MKTAKYYVKGNLIFNLLKGKYGAYAKMHGNTSGKKMLEQGFEIRDLTQCEAQDIRNAHNEELRAEKVSERFEKLADRAKQIDICITCQPLILGSGNELWEHVTHVGCMAEAYHGCGKGTAYIRGGCIVAFHYGYDQPCNVPSNCIAQEVEFSCFEILF